MDFRYSLCSLGRIFRGIADRHEMCRQIIHYVGNTGLSKRKVDRVAEAFKTKECIRWKQSIRSGTVCIVWGRDVQCQYHPVQLSGLFPSGIFGTAVAPKAKCQVAGAGQSLENNRLYGDGRRDRLLPHWNRLFYLDRISDGLFQNSDSSGVSVYLSDVCFFHFDFSAAADQLSGGESPVACFYFFSSFFCTDIFCLGKMQKRESPVGGNERSARFPSCGRPKNSGVVIAWRKSVTSSFS